MSNIAARLRTLRMKVDDNFLVLFILNTLNLKYEAFQINFTSIKDKWDVSELSSMLNEEMSRLKKQVGHSINHMGKRAAKGHKTKSNKLKKNKTPAKVSQDAYKELKVDVFHFC